MQKTFYYIILCAIQVNANSIQAGEPSVPERVRNSKLFASQIIWVGQSEPSATESGALIQAIEQSRGAGALPRLEEFVGEHPNSPWVPSLRANLASYYRSIGKYST